jgi:hypothetical protein
MLAKGITIFDEFSDYIPLHTWTRSETSSIARSHGGPGGKGIIDYGDNEANAGVQRCRCGSSAKICHTYTFTYTLSHAHNITCFICSYLKANAKHLKSAGRKAVGVQVPLRAPMK